MSFCPACLALFFPKLDELNAHTIRDLSMKVGTISTCKEDLKMDEERGENKGCCVQLSRMKARESMQSAYRREDCREEQGISFLQDRDLRIGPSNSQS